MAETVTSCGFNSMIVRLKAPMSLLKPFSKRSFNSMIVRLKGNMGGNRFRSNHRFNSMIVRLKDCGEYVDEEYYPKVSIL